jgi:hypothetical protein
VDLIYLLPRPMGHTIREDKIENDKRKTVDMKGKKMNDSCVDLTYLLSRPMGHKIRQDKRIIKEKLLK